MIKLVLFYSEGQSFDKGINLTKEKEQMVNQYKDEFDEIIVYTPRILRELGYHQSVKEYESSGLVSGNEKQNYIGFCAWKPLIIKLELLKSKKEDILMYHDVNCTKYPVYLSFKNVRNQIKILLEKGKYDFFLPRENITLKYHCKTNVLRELGNNDLFNYNFKMLCVNCMIFRNTFISLTILDEWIQCCNHEPWLNGEKYGELVPEFIWHCPEQSIFSNIVANWIKRKKYNIPFHFPYIGFCNRNMNHIIDINLS